MEAVTHAARTVLTWGFRISLTVVLVGLVVAIARDEPLAAEMGSPTHVWNLLLDGHSNGILGLGILVMILAPVVSIASICLSFFRIGDRRFGLFSLIVLTIMIVSAVTNIGG